VMNSIKELSFFTEPLPAKLYHLVLVLVPPRTNVDTLPVVAKILTPDTVKQLLALAALHQKFAKLMVHNPSQSEQELGQTTFRIVKDLNLFSKHEHNPLLEPMLTEKDANELNSLIDSHRPETLTKQLFDVKMTHIIQNALGLDVNLVNSGAHRWSLDPDVDFVNSEVYRWLQETGVCTVTDFQPDYIVTLKGLYERKDEPKDDSQEARNLARTTHGTTFHFGHPPKELWNTVTILQSKLNFNEEKDFGEVVRYLEHLNEHAHAVLFDRRRCWLIRTRENHDIRSIEEVNWSFGGSKQKFVDFILSSLDPWRSVVLEACNIFNVELADSNAFLGAGATGRVFKVRRLETAETFALKLVVETDDVDVYSLHDECNLLKAAHGTGVVASVIQQFKRFRDGTAAGMLISPVGSPISRRNLSLQLLHQIAQALFALHKGGFEHGDSRLANLIQTDDNQLLWIDPRFSYFNMELRWKQDASALSRSILNLKHDPVLPKFITTLIDQYALNQDNVSCLALADGWWSELQLNAGCHQ
ncbi:hypothetical protein HDU99_001143, partial [Rhizoclosmatium hyalinum]